MAELGGPKGNNRFHPVYVVNNFNYERINGGLWVLELEAHSQQAAPRHGSRSTSTNAPQPYLSRGIYVAPLLKP
jgi:hypothetical protein